MAKFPPHLLDQIRERLTASDVIGRSVKLRKEGREWRGLSPFTNEKTPSFFVNDEKGKFFDFSSGKSGDIISFLQETQSLSFPEAVQQLADLAGLEIPKDTPEEQRRAARAKTLGEAQLEAARCYRTMLSRTDGEGAATYLAKRGVSAKARDAFGLGYAPGTRTALLDYMLNKDYSLDVLVEGGLVIKPDDGGKPYDKFRDRLMFPILGGKGKVIAFGGRALSSNVQAKYMNSPETPLFHKSSTLYNLHMARKRAASGDRPVLVAEGYMDVIALHEAGWPAVAPLGTALTPDQLKLLWRFTDVPVLCFDGDRAGQAAAYRAIDRALPLLSAGKSLRFAFLPDGQDPDDLLRSAGPEAVGDVIDAAKPLADVLWAHDLETVPHETPEERAAFRQHLRQRVGAIAEPDVRRAYGEFFAEKLRGVEGDRPTPLEPIIEGPMPYNGAYDDGPPPMEYEQDPYQQAAKPASSYQEPQRQPQRGRGKKPWPPPPTASPELKASALQMVGSAQLAEAVLVLTLCNHPSLFDKHDDDAMSLIIRDKGLNHLYRVVIEGLIGGEVLDTQALRSHINENTAAATTYSYWTTHSLIRLEKFVRAEASFESAEKGWLNALSKYRYHGELETEIADAAAGAHRDETVEKIWRDAINLRARMMNEHKPDDGPND